MFSKIGAGAALRRHFNQLLTTAPNSPAMPAHPLLIVAALAFSFLSTSPGRAGDGFQEAARGAVAILPQPLKSTVITGGSVSCTEQRWTLRLRAERGDPAASWGSDATLAIDGETSAATAEQSWHDITIPLASETLDLIKEGSRLQVAIDGGEPASATFSLKGSRAVLDSVAPRCSAIDMSGYEAVTLAPGGPGADSAQLLLADEMALFRQDTGKDARIASATMELGGGKRLLFASLCAVTNYYGETGCKLVGYGAEAAREWQPVYESEGMLLYRDPNGSRDGWPNLATVPMVNGSEALSWSWDGQAYALQDPAVADGTALELRGSSSQ